MISSRCYVTRKQVSSDGREMLRQGLVRGRDESGIVDHFFCRPDESAHGRIYHPGLFCVLGFRRPSDLVRQVSYTARFLVFLYCLQVSRYKFMVSTFLWKRRTLVGNDAGNIRLFPRKNWTLSTGIRRTEIEGETTSNNLFLKIGYVVAGGSRRNGDVRICSTSVQISIPRSQAKRTALLLQLRSGPRTPQP